MPWARWKRRKAGKEPWAQVRAQLCPDRWGCSSRVPAQRRLSFLSGPTAGQVGTCRPEALAAAWSASRAAIWAHHSVSRELGYHESIPQSPSPQGLGAWTYQAQGSHPTLTLPPLLSRITTHYILALSHVLSS